jgi:hypothetical protein
MYDATASPRLDDAVLDAIAVEFDGSPNPIIGVYTENLTATQPATSIRSGMNLLHARSHGSEVGFQPLNVFATLGDMDSAIRLGRESYGGQYFEIYRTNTETASFGEYLEKWQNIMNGIAVPGGCAILSTGTGSQTISPTGTGSETIFYPTLE